VRGNAMLDNIRNKVIDESMGIVVVNPLKYLITLEWCLAYKNPDDINKPELIKPCANIITKHANKPSKECVNMARVTKPIWATEE